MITIIILAAIFLFLIILAALSAYLLLFHLGPGPVSRILRKAFEKSPAKPPDDFSRILSESQDFPDIEYPSEYGGNTLDIFLPRKDGQLFPLILWTHGGGFVGGDKKDVYFFARTLASCGCAVVSLNYELAPEGRYPTPLIQMNEVYRYLSVYEEKYSLDLKNIFLAGDSAGAHIAGQAACAISDSDYAKTLPFRIDIPTDHLKGVLLYCGLFSMQEKIFQSRNPLLREIWRTIAWSYFGEKKWQDGHLSHETDIIQHVSGRFPPVFITDGNTFSFEEQAKKLADRLSQLNVSVSSLFFPANEYRTLHEYQFIQNTYPAQIAVEQTLAFLEKYVGDSEGLTPNINESGSVIS